jgi:transcriptional regulator with XRE-family HTH domain
MKMVAFMPPILLPLILRSARKLSQEGLAELAGFHRTYVSQLERCVTNISIDGLERLAHALNVDMLELLK